MILELVKMFLVQANEGKADMPDAVIEEFGEKCKEIMRAQFKPKETKAFTLRMSSVGRPLCQLQMEKAGEVGEPDDYAHRFKMLLGDMVEAAAIAVMRSAGVNIEAVQKQVTVNVGGANINGTLDVKIDGEIWDIKSASPYAFKEKFASPDGFHKIREDDAFGYIPQGYLYGEGEKSRFKGWIAVNKATGEWAVCEVPLADNAYKKEAIYKADTSIRGILEDKPFKRCYEAIEESFRGRKTGNKYLDVTCSYCSFKQKCWAKEGLTYAAQPKSEAKTPRRFWYVGELHT